jgi:hypothetical protein
MKTIDEKKLMTSELNHFTHFSSPNVMPYAHKKKIETPMHAMERTQAT